MRAQIWRPREVSSTTCSNLLDPTIGFEMWEPYYVYTLSADGTFRRTIRPPMSIHFCESSRREHPEILR